jgi:hypothetical protein
VPEVTHERYPEIGAHGTLARAVTAAAARRGADLGAVSTPGIYEFMQQCRPALIECGAQRATVYCTHGEPRFGVGFSRGSRVQGEGSTDDLDVVVDLAAAWCAGVSLRDAAERFPFVVASEEALAFEAGTHVEHGWAYHLRHLDDYPNLRSLLRAAAADERLRALYPSVGHDEVLTLELVRGGGETAGFVEVSLLPSGRYQVSARAGEETGPYDLADAVRIASTIAAAWPA